LFRLRSALLLLNNLSNVLFGEMMLPMLKMALVILTNVCSSALIRFNREMDVVSFVFLAGLTATAPILLISSANLMTSIFSGSVHFQRKMKERIMGLKDQAAISYYRKRLQSTQVLKCRVGHFYDMEAEAQLTLADNIIRGIFFLLLAK